MIHTYRSFPLLILICSFLYSQSTVHEEGIRKNTPAVHALKNLTIVTAPGKKILKGTIVIRDGIIQSVGSAVTIPPDAREWDCTGLTAYAGFIDLYTDYGLPKPKPPVPGQTPEQPRGANYWNSNIKADFSSAQNFLPDKEAAEKLRAIGITAVLSVPQGGILKGTSALVNVGDEAANSEVLQPSVFQHALLGRDGFTDSYPGSLMGVIALIRQTVIDAKWYSDAQRIYAKNPNQRRPEENKTLAALEPVLSGKQTVVFETGNELKELRSAAIAKEFSIPFLLCGNGYEYKRLDAIKELKVPIILPVNFPDPPSIENPEDAMNADYDELRYWDFASENPGRLKKAGVTIALTTHLLKDISKFPSMVRTAIDCGLNADDALASVTTIPAQLAGMDKKLGTLEEGKIANIVLTDGEMFGEKTKVRETWVEGRRYEIKVMPAVEARGTWSYSLNLSGERKDTGTIEISGESESLVATVKKGGKSVKVSSVSCIQKQMMFSFDGDSIGMSGTVRLSGSVNEGRIFGLYSMADGKSGSWSGMLMKPFEAKADTSKPSVPVCATNDIVYPDGAFGRAAIPDQPENILVKNATLWTSGPLGNLANTDFLITRGKVAKIGKDIAAPNGAVVIDAAGKHVTAGLIDCHSHTAISEGINEAGQAVTAEVRIGDVINPDDINIYRELAGGLTVANVLHGSANAIGGQNQVIKLRWGMSAEQMKFEGAIPGIKFALGENPKQANWGDRFTARYPQTRMGVEQLIRDEFTAARDYEKAMKDSKANPSLIPPHRDLELDAMVEILNGKRLVHSHCYRQDEIMMLLKVSDDFGFQVGTLQHVLEGYKIADEIAKRGVGASCFSDWWAYKYEVIDAIPYAGALMHDAGVVVSYNSDSDELARRLNWEAAKAVKYGGVSEIEALKFVTINPAKQLRIDNRVGSLEVGKDADFVVWSGSPLSAYSKCEQTWIDGRKYFDKDEDARMRDELLKKRSELVQKVLQSKKKGAGPMPSQKRSSSYSCHDDRLNTEEGGSEQ